VKMNRLTCDKKQLVQSLHAMNIGVQVHYIPVHHHPVYRQLGYSDFGLQNSVSFYEKVISLPLFAKMTEDDLLDVIAALDVITETFGIPGLV